MFNDEEELEKLLEELEDGVQYELEEGRTTDYMIIYAIARRFIIPFKKWKAYEFGLIDDKGKVIRSPKSMKEKNAFTPLDHVILKIKRLIPTRLWYLLTASYIFKGFIRTPIREVWDCHTEEEIIEVEEKKLKLEQAHKRVHDIIENNPHFTEEEFWHYIANKQND